MRWTLIERPRLNSLDTTVYRSADGRWTLCKEFYADGSSMFSWMLYGPDTESRFENEFPTKKAASAHVDALNQETP